MKTIQSFIQFGAVLAATCLTAAAVEVAELKIEFDELPSPEVSTGKNKSFKPKDWLEMEVEMKIPAQNRMQQEAGFLDRVLVKWFVAIEDKATGRPVLLTLDVPHVNIPIDEEIFSSVYLSPNTVKRLTGVDRGAKSKVQAVGVQILVDGTMVGIEGEGIRLDPGNPWWNSPQLARGDRFPLLNKNQTPFKMLWWDRYAEIEEERR